MILMEKPADENSQHLTTPSNDAVHDQDNMAPASTNHGGTKLECEVAEEEVKGILEVIASTGKFWHDWYKLKSTLSFQLKQVLSEYPESKMTIEQQNASLGETYPELAKRLDEALLSFVEGPPFTLQRLCEILLEGKSIYPSLSKLCFSTREGMLLSTHSLANIMPFLFGLSSTSAWLPVLRAGIQCNKSVEDSRVGPHPSLLLQDPTLALELVGDIYDDHLY